ncbi:MAG TPA: glycosyltransferase [bacterium]|nr:glycosyltransferase [bacterium]HPS28772.1 glycosyltransferase [bacterium]
MESAEKFETKRLILITGVNSKERLKPAFAVAEILRKRGIQSVFAFAPGSELQKGIKEKGYEVVNFPKFAESKGAVGNFLRSMNRKKIAKNAVKIMTDKHISGVLTMGGVSAIPVIDAAVKMNLMIFIMEENAEISSSNMEVLPFAKRIYLPFAELMSGVDRSKALVTGVPVEKDVMSAVGRNIPTDKKLLVIFSCRHNSNSINELVRSLFRKYPEMRKEFFVLQETGEKEVASIQRFYDELKVESLCYMQYENRGKYYKTADIIICRPTADVVSELLASHKPGVFLPLPPNIDRYQKSNAILLSKKDCGYLVEDSGGLVIRTKKLYSVLTSFLEKGDPVKQNIAKLQFEKAAAKVAEDMERVLLTGR